MFNFYAGIPDMINGSFEFIAAPFILLSIFKLRREKEVRGVSYLHVAYFTSWSFWNLFYYPHLGQWASFVGGILVAFINFIWLIQLIYYTSLEKKRMGLGEDKLPELSDDVMKETRNLIRETVRRNMPLKSSGLLSVGEETVIKNRKFVVTNVSTHKVTFKILSR